MILHRLVQGLLYVLSFGAWALMTEQISELTEWLTDVVVVMTNVLTEKMTDSAD
jgi:hypothetical protein